MCSPTKEKKIRSGYLTLALSGPKKGKCYVTPATSRIPKQRGRISEVAPSPLPSGWKCYITLAFSGIPKTKGDQFRSGYHTPAFSGAQKRAKKLRGPCILRVPSKADKIKRG